MGRACWIKSAKSFFPTVQCVETLETAHWLPQANNTLTNRQNVVAPLNDGEGWGVVSHQPGLWISGSCQKKCHFSDRRKKNLSLFRSVHIIIMSPPTSPFPIWLKDSRRDGKKRGRSACICCVCFCRQEGFSNITSSLFRESQNTPRKNIKEQIKTLWV